MTTEMARATARTAEPAAQIHERNMQALDAMLKDPAVTERLEKDRSQMIAAATDPKKVISTNHLDLQLPAGIAHAEMRLLPAGANLGTLQTVSDVYVVTKGDISFVGYKYDSNRGIDIYGEVMLAMPAAPMLLSGGKTFELKHRSAKPGEYATVLLFSADPIRLHEAVVTFGRKK